MTAQEQATPIFVLVDGAAHPFDIAEVLRRAGTDVRNVYAGLPEADAGEACLFLARLGDAKAPWFAKLVALDMSAPCLTLIWSRVEIRHLAHHLRQFLIADIGDGMSALIRYFDPRNLPVAMAVWGEEIRDRLMRPIEEWRYRGRSAEWERIVGPTGGIETQTEPLTIRLSQEQLDRLEAHCEPDQLLAALEEAGIAPGEGAYLERFTDFALRYRRAIDWGLTEPVDRKHFCELSYRFGTAFDQHSVVRAALEERRRTGISMAECERGIPSYAWMQLQAGNNKREVI